MLRPDERDVGEVLRSIWLNLEARISPDPVDEPEELEGEIERLHRQLRVLDDEFEECARDQRWDLEDGSSALEGMQMLSEMMLKLDDRRRWTLARIGELEGRRSRRRRSS